MFTIDYHSDSLNLEQYISYWWQMLCMYNECDRGDLWLDMSICVCSVVYFSHLISQSIHYLLCHIICLQFTLWNLCVQVTVHTNGLLLQMFHEITFIFRLTRIELALRWKWCLNLYYMVEFYYSMYTANKHGQYQTSVAGLYYWHYIIFNINLKLMLSKAA